MKKITLLFSAVLFSAVLQAQTVNFKIAFKPNTVYTQTTVQSNKLEFTYGGEPMMQEQNSTTVNTITTGSQSNNEIPVTMVLKMEEGAQGAAELNGAKITGKASTDAAPVFTAIEAPNLPEQAKEVILNMMTEAVSQTFLPAKQVKVGETFVQEVPMNIPLGPVTLNMKDVVTYKLDKVEVRKAYFNLNHVITLDMDVQGENMKGSGTGTGQMVYDMDKNYPLQNDAQLQLQMGFVTEGMAMDIKNNSTSKVSTVITPSK